MKVKTSELQGAALDWAVAKCEGMEFDEDTGATVLTGEYWWDDEGLQWPVEWEPSTNWAQGGSIIERLGVALSTTTMLGAGAAYAWQAALRTQRQQFGEYGPTPLVAAMRCYVASRLGDEVEVPDELL